MSELPGTSVGVNYNWPGVPPPMDPRVYTPVPSAGADFTRQRGNFDPAAIPVHPSRLTGPDPQILPNVPINSVPDQPQPPSENTSVPVQPQVPSVPPLADVNTLVGLLIENQTALQSSQAMFQQSLADVMTEVARRPVINPAGQIQNPTARGGTVRLRTARIFSGKHADVTPFLSEVKRIIDFHASSFPDDHSKVLYVGLNLKDGIPVEWFSHLENSNSALLWDWNLFLSAFRKKFADPSLITTADTRLDHLKQTGSAHYYLTSFMELASHLDMTEQTKISRFMKGLKPLVKDHLVNIVQRPLTLEAWEPLIISIDSNLHQRELEHRLENGNTNKKKNKSDFNSSDPNPTFSPSTTTSSSDVVPMDVDAISTGPRGKLSDAERKHRFDNKLCLYCGNKDHIVKNCKIRAAKHGAFAEKAQPKTT